MTVLPGLLGGGRVGAGREAYVRWKCSSGRSQSGGLVYKKMAVDTVVRVEFPSFVGPCPLACVT
jgi:hypothetical protein